MFRITEDPSSGSLVTLLG